MFDFLGYLLFDPSNPWLITYLRVVNSLYFNLFMFLVSWRLMVILSPEKPAPHG